MDTIEMKMANIAAQNWNSDLPQNLEEAKALTGGSEVSAVKSIISVLGLDSSLESQLMEDVYTKEKITPEIAQIISERMSSVDEAFGGPSKKIVDMLSIIHDGWIKNNPDKFLQEGRNKEYQFSPLMLLDYKEANSDLIFLKPILEAAGVEVDEQKIQQEFDIRQKEFLIDYDLNSEQDITDLISRGFQYFGEKAHTALDGVETKNGGEIITLLQNPEVAEKMAKQIADRVPIKSIQERAMDIVKSDNESMFDCAWVKTVRDDLCSEYNGDRCPKLDRPISRREVLLSKLIGKPYPSYFLHGVVDFRSDAYRNELQIGDEHESEIKEYKQRILNYAMIAKENKDTRLEEPKFVDFGYFNTYVAGPKKMGGKIEVSEIDLIKAGINPGNVDIRRKTEEELSLENTEGNKTKKRITLSGIKSAVTKFLNKDKDNDKEL